jgi:uncharacterized protein YecE (DUF72 family)
VAGVFPLFEDLENGDSGGSGFDRRGLAAKLQRLASQGVWIGTSSWKYEGWLGQIYHRDRYLTRGKFSQKRFEQECLAEYAETFPIVCGDFSFYQFPSDAYWSRLFASVPRSLQFAFKVPEDVTIKTFPSHARYGPRAGTENANFLNPDIFAAGFAGPLMQYRRQVAVLIFEFGAFSRRAMEDVDAFLRVLDPFLARLPTGFRYSVEIRNPEFLTRDYFQALHNRGVAHVFNAWSKMPEIGVQTALPGAFTADFTVARALLRQGRVYEEAVTKFSPYATIQDVNPAARSALKGLIQRAKAKKEPSFVFVNNRLEGNAPMTIEAVVEDD